MLAELVTRSRIGRAVIRRLGDQRARDIVTDIAPHLGDGTILDIGAGTCQVAEFLASAGHDVIAADIRNLSCSPAVEPILFDGGQLPFNDGAFGTALLITVLHHTADPERTLREAARVARRIVVQEDIYASAAQKYATMVMDSVVNLEFVGHPHSNRSDAEWRATFERLGLRLVAASYRKIWRVFSSATYLVEPLRPL